MRIEIDPSALKKTRWYEFAVRFLFGGLITAATGLIAKKFGPGVGGLFLAFPAIFPASATLIEKHEKQKKERAGLDGSARGRKAAAVDAAGAAIGSLGLLSFAGWSSGCYPAIVPGWCCWARPGFGWPFLCCFGRCESECRRVERNNARRVSVETKLSLVAEG